MPIRRLRLERLDERARDWVGRVTCHSELGLTLENGLDTGSGPDPDYKTFFYQQLWNAYLGI